MVGERPDYALRVLELFEGFGDREAIVGVAHPEATALLTDPVGLDRRLTYAQARAMVLDMAAQLRAGGFEPGMTVGVMVAHPPEAPLLQLALHLLGCRTAWFAAGTSRQETDDYLRQIRPEAFIYDARTHPRIGRELTESLGLPTFCLGSRGVAPNLLIPRPELAPFDLASATGRPESIFQTSGTTGVPKPIHHGPALYEQMTRLGEDWVAQGGAALRHMTLSPLWYVAGQTSSLMNLVGGGVLYVMVQFDPQEYLETIRDNEVTSAYISPVMFQELLDHPGGADIDTSSLRLLSVGGAALTPTRLRQGIERFGPVIRVTYGLSESPFISAFPNITDDPDRPDRIRSCGTAYGDVRLEIRGEDGETVLPTGEIGEIWIASRLNFLGYWNRPDATAETMRDGWLRTKDLAYLDEEGYIHLAGRTQDMIITGLGCENIFPRPIEDVLATHPAVRSVAVIGVPHPTLGEAAHAYLVKADAAEVTEEELSELVAERLTPLWRPQSYEFLDELPRTRSNKADLKTLKAKWAADHTEDAQPVMIGVAG